MICKKSSLIFHYPIADDLECLLKIVLTLKWPFFLLTDFTKWFLGRFTIIFSRQSLRRVHDSFTELHTKILNLFCWREPHQFTMLIQEYIQMLNELTSGKIWLGNVVILFSWKVNQVGKETCVCLLICFHQVKCKKNSQIQTASYQFSQGKVRPNETVKLNAFVAAKSTKLGPNLELVVISSINFLSSYSNLNVW